MTRRCLQNINAAVLTVFLLLAGCRSVTPPVEFYALTPLPNTSAGKKADEFKNDIAVGIGSVTLPKLNDRPQIVTRTDPNRIKVHEFHRWAGSLYEDFLRVLTVNLSLLLQTNLVAAYPWEDYFDPDYRIFVQVHQFDGRLGDYVALDVTWTLTGREAREVLAVRRFQMKAPVKGRDYDTFVAAKSSILADFSREIARAIELLNKSN
jgi:uncharacterized lipoprotein YmbA